MLFWSILATAPVTVLRLALSELPAAAPLVALPGIAEPELPEVEPVLVWP
jgi:hypothetical protein